MQDTPPAATSQTLIWIGRVLSGLIVVGLLLSGAMKFTTSPEMDEGLAHIGFPKHLVRPLGVLEIACAVIYAIPQTAVLGAILVTGYFGGAICTHLRVGDAYIVQALFPVVTWLALYLRDSRLRALLPLRSL